MYESDEQLGLCHTTNRTPRQDPCLARSRAGTRGSLEARPAPVSRWQPRPAPGAKFEETGLAHLIRRQTLKKQFKST
ncbi:hypothetical protein ACQJBY_038625 [Aegilops geniculata]